MPETTQEIDYEIVRRVIDSDSEVRALDRNIRQTKQALQELVGNAEQIWRTRVATLVVEEGIGFYGEEVSDNRALSKVFPKDRYSTQRAESQGVSVLTLIDTQDEKERT